MSKFIEVMAIVEGKTEEIFIKSLLSKYLAPKHIYMTATQVSKPGQKGGDVRFERVKNDLEIHLKQRPDTFVTTLVDYYGVKEWPGLDLVPMHASPTQIAQIVNKATKDQVIQLFEAQQASRRFIPYMAVHEFEALLFSDSAALAKELYIEESLVQAVLDQCGEPEAINNSPMTAPSKRLNKWSPYGKFPKTTTGREVARAIGIQKMRQHCPLFHTWLQRLETLVEASG